MPPGHPHASGTADILFLIYTDPVNGVTGSVHRA